MKKYTLLCVLAVLCAVPAFAQGGRYDTWAVDSNNHFVSNPTVRVCTYTAPWSSTVAYIAGNTVTYNGGFYTALASSTNVTPGTDGTKWQSGNCSPLAMIYGNAALTVSQANPFIGDAYGNYGFWGSGNYTVQVSGTGIATVVYSVTIGSDPLQLAPRTDQQFVFYGDSLTAGYNTTNCTTNLSGQQYTACSYALQAQSLPFFKNRGTSVISGSVGAFCDTLASAYTASVQPYKPNGTTIKKSYLFFECGHNSLVGENQTALQVEAIMQPLWASAHTDGFTVVGFTVPAGTSFTAAQETERRSYNTWMRAQSCTAATPPTTGQCWDYLYDFAADFHDFTDRNVSTDGTHLTTSGYLAMAYGVNRTMMNGGGPMAPSGNVSLSSGIAPLIIAAGDISAATDDTHAVVYLGTDGNVYLRRNGLTTVYVKGASLGASSTGLTVGGAGEISTVTGTAAGTLYFGSDASVFLTRNGATDLRVRGANMHFFPAVTYGIDGVAYVDTPSLRISGSAGSAGQCLTNIGGVQQWGACSGTTVSGVAVRTGYCTGTATASTTISLFGFGELSASTCTGTTPSNIGSFVSTASLTKVQNLIVTASTAGVNASSGLCTIYDNGAATALTCTVGTATSCSDSTHAPTVTPGHFYGLRCTTQAGETLGGLNASVEFK